MGAKMKIISRFIVFAIVISLSFTASAAQKMKEATVEYSGDLVMETQAGTVTGKQYYGLNGKIRQEMTAQGMTSIMISRQDKKVAWILMPDQKMYMESSLEESAKKSGTTNVNDCDVDMTAQGDETVNGVKATKYKVSMSCPDKANYDGNMWVTKEGIMVKMDAVAGQGSQQMRIKMDLKNLKIGTQDAGLFEIPAGYQKFSMGDISSMIQGAQKQAAEAQKAQAEKEKAQAEREAKEEAGRAYTSKRAYTSSAKASSSETKASGINDSVEKVDNTADEANKVLDTNDKVKGTVDRIKGLFGR